MTTLAAPPPVRPGALILSSHAQPIVRAILDGTLSHKRLKEAFLWEATPEGHMYWSKVRQSAGLSQDAAQRLHRALNNCDWTNKLSTVY